MKSFKLFSLLVLAFCLTTACTKSTDEIPQANNADLSISEEEAIEVIEGALSANSQGISSETAAMAELGAEASNFTGQAHAKSRSQQNILECGVPRDTTFNTSKNTANLTANYELSVNFLLHCTQVGLPQSIDYQKTSKGSHETKRFSSQDASESNWTLNNIVTGADYIANGKYSRTGTQSSKVHNKKQFSYKITVEAENLKVDKGEQTITSGKGSLALEGTDASGKNYSFKGEIVFTGNQTATVILNGETYTIDW
jgi:hypothetical protein